MSPLILIKGCTDISACHMEFTKHIPVMDQILQFLDHVVCFLDDILITAPIDVEHLVILDIVLSRLEAHGVRVNLAKCQFFQKEVEYLGHRVDVDGIHHTADKLKAIAEAPAPTSQKQLRSVLGLINYYGKFIEGLSTTL